MTSLDSINNCKNFISKLSSQDTLLSAVDQRSQIAEYLSQVNEALARLEKDISSKWIRLIEETSNEALKMTDQLQQANANLVEIFDALATSAKNADNNVHASIALGQQVQNLSRLVRPRMSRFIDKFSPRYRVLEKSLVELPGFHVNITKFLPDKSIVLINREKPEFDTTGKNIFELEYLPNLDALCNPPFLCSVRYSILRHRCNRTYKLIQIPLRSLAVHFLTAHGELNVAGLVSRHHATHDELQNRLTDAWRSLRYNLDTASTELEDLYYDIRSEAANTKEGIEERHQELLTLCQDAITQNLETIDDVRVVYASFLNSAISEIEDAHKRAMSALEETLNHPQALKPRLLRKAELNNRKVQQGNRDLTTPRTRALEIFGFIESQTEKTNQYFRLLNLWKRSKQTEESLLQLADLPTQAELVESARSLPPIYRRLFRNEPLHNREFLVGMDDEFTHLENAYTRWQDGKAATVAIIGPEGSGKTSLMNCFENELDTEHPVTRSEIRHRMQNKQDVIHEIEDILEIPNQHEDATDLSQTICKMGRRIVIVEDGQNILFRKVGAREAVDTFFHVVMATRQFVFWVISFRLHPWIRMSYMYQIERYFTHAIKSELHNEEELKNAILVRQRAAGQTPEFSAEGIKNYKINKLANKHKPGDLVFQSALSDYFFANLYEFSGGNMNSALYYWLQSLHVDEDGHVIVKPCNKVDMSFVKKLDQNYLFTLAEILIHGGLTIHQHCELFGLDADRSRLTLEYLRQIRLLQSLGKDRYDQPLHYSINTLFFQPITSTLKDMHILY